MPNRADEAATRELTPEMQRLLDACVLATLSTLRRQYPRDAEVLYVTLISRSFLDFLRDQDPAQARRLADLFNGPDNETPWRLVMQAN